LPEWLRRTGFHSLVVSLLAGGALLAGLYAQTGTIDPRTSTPDGG